VKVIKPTIGSTPRISNGKSHPPAANKNAPTGGPTVHPLAAENSAKPLLVLGKVDNKVKAV
jgi:hypothetical protein